MKTDDSHSDRSEIVQGILAGLLVSVVVLAIGRYGLGWFKPATPALPMTPNSTVLAEPGSRTAPPANAARPRVVRHPDFHGERAAPDVHRLAQWIAATGDAGDAEFVIIDKQHAHIFVFDRDVALRASAPVLIGAAIGDDTVPGIGERPLDKVLPEEKTTPAGRFVGERGHNARGEDVVWVDYDAAVSMHRVLTTNKKERRLERLATPTTADNRISFGCINLPKAFYEEYVGPIFAQHRAIVYIMPDVKRLEDVFPIGGEAMTTAPKPKPSADAMLRIAQRED